jgi:DNA (cytosine-5)-methyltransferase 1
MNAIDFFCGAGGLTRGLLDSGIKVFAGVDHALSCKRTYEENNQIPYVCSDIRSITKEYLVHKFPYEMKHNDDLLFAGCAPCQPFSSQRRSFVVRTDAGILDEFSRLVGDVLPGFIIIENVPGFVTKHEISPYARFKAMLQAHNYQIAPGLINACNYGVPQSRKRFILMASRVGDISLPEATHGPGKVAYRTVRDTISGYPAISAGSYHVHLPNHKSATISELNLVRLAATPVDGGDRRSWPEHLVLTCHKEHKGHTDVYGRMWWDKPAPTLTGKCYSISNGRYGHPTQNRAISLREAAALQTFSDDYIFYGTQQSIALQIGNAVPVTLAKALGKAVMESKPEKYSVY